MAFLVLMPVMLLMGLGISKDLFLFLKMALRLHHRTAKRRFVKCFALASEGRGLSNYFFYFMGSLNQCSYHGRSCVSGA